jgi:hypothetical protein
MIILKWTREAKFTSLTKILAENLKCLHPFGDFRVGRKLMSKKNLARMRYEFTDCIKMAQDIVEWRAFITSMEAGV